MNDERGHTVREAIEGAIRGGDVHMRPRWYFLLLSALALLGACVLLATLLYLASFAIFLLRDSGAWVAPSFGARGWLVLLRSIPWLAVLFFILFLAIFELIVKRYSIVYRKPLLVSLCAIALLTVLGGFVLARAPMHRSLMRSAREGMLPAPFGMWYRSPLGVTHPRDALEGTIVATGTARLVVRDAEGTSTETILLTPRTRFPLGEDFSIGDRVIAVGDEVGTDTMQAFGVRQIDK